MAKGHWLDPLARSLLQATGKLPRPATTPRPASTASIKVSEPDVHEQVEQDLLDLKLRQNPALPLKDADEVRRLAALGWRLDVNRATAADWARLPGCRPEQIDLLLRLQAGGVQLSGPDDLQRLLELDSLTLRGWLPLLSFQWYGTPQAVKAPEQVAINLANPEVLAHRLALDPVRLDRLLRERRRSPFQDLADLQQRLQLPPAVVEAWIGKVSFQHSSIGPGGPSLPGNLR